jgi:hypothetical protein
MSYTSPAGSIRRVLLLPRIGTLGGIKGEGHMCYSTSPKNPPRGTKQGRGPARVS